MAGSFGTSWTQFTWVMLPPVIVCMGIQTSTLTAWESNCQHMYEIAVAAEYKQKSPYKDYKRMVMR